MINYIKIMIEQLYQLGLTEKEIKSYLTLIQEGVLTASQLSTHLKESRTNTYALLEKLINIELVETDTQLAVKRYIAKHPENLKKILLSKQQELKQSQQALAKTLPELTSLYQLGSHRPGVTHFQGIDGYEAFQNTVSRSSHPICVLASNVVPENKDAWKTLQNAIKKRVDRGIRARIIFHTDAKNWLDQEKFEKDGYDVRFWGKSPLIGEFAIFGDKIGLTSYQPVVVTTVITNDIIAATFKTIFDQLWELGEEA